MKKDPSVGVCRVRLTSPSLPMACMGRKDDGLARDRRCDMRDYAYNDGHNYSAVPEPVPKEFLMFMGDL